MFQYIITVATQVGIMFLLMLVGYVLYKVKIIHDSSTEDFSNLLLKITMPCAIVVSYQREFDLALLQKLGIGILLSVMAYGVSILIATLVYPKHQKDSPSCRACAVLTNCGCVGLPLLESLMGPEGVFLGSGFIMVTTVFLWTYGIATLTAGKQRVSPTKILLNPGTIAMFFGLLVFISPVKLPTIVFSSLQGLANMNMPLAMLVIGMFVAQMDIRQCFSRGRVMLMSLMRLVVIPGVVLAVLFVLPLDSNTKIATFMGVASPCSMAVPMLSKVNDGDYLFTSQCVVNSTLLSILSLPVLLTLSSMIL